jgi:hypothetical protein
MGCCREGWRRAGLDPDQSPRSAGARAHARSGRRRGRLRSTSWRLSPFRTTCPSGLCPRSSRRAEGAALLTCDTRWQPGVWSQIAVCRVEFPKTIPRTSWLRPASTTLASTRLSIIHRLVGLAGEPTTAVLEHRRTRRQVLRPSVHVPEQPQQVAPSQCRGARPLVDRCGDVLQRPRHVVQRQSDHGLLVHVERF